MSGEEAQTPSSGKTKDDFEFSSEPKVKESLADLRNDSSPSDWLVFGYNESNQLEVKKMGEDGLEEAQKEMQETDVLYFVLSVPLVIEGTRLVKFILVTWIGPKVKPFSRARATQHKLPLYKYVNSVLQLAGELQALNKEEFTEETVKSKLLGTRVLGDEEKETSSVLKSKGVGSSEKFQFQDEAAFVALLNDLRNHNNPLTWIKLGYKESEKESLCLLQTGNGNTSEFASTLEDSEVAYLLFSLKVEDSVSEGYSQNKFILITWVGVNVLPLHRARSSQHRHSLYQFSKKSVQLAGEIQILTREDLTEHNLKEKLVGTFSQTQRTEEELKAAAQKGMRRTVTVGEGTAAGGGITGSYSPKPLERKQASFKSPLEDELSAVDAVKELHSPDSPTKWILFHYNVAKNKVGIAKKGEGSISDLQEEFTPEQVFYSILTLSTVGEGDYSTKKYLFLTWVGPSVKPLHKARSSQHRVALYNFFNKHITLCGELSAHSKHECSEEQLLEKMSSSRQSSDSSDNVDFSQVEKTVKSKAGSQFQLDEERTNAALEDLRSKSATNWVVFGIKQGESVITVLNQGSEGLEQMKGSLTDDSISYAILSTLVEEKESGDEYKTVKSLFISWVGVEVKPLVKAKSTQHRFSLYTFIKKSVNVAGELQVLSRSDLTEELVLKKLSSC